MNPGKYSADIWPVRAALALGGAGVLAILWSALCTVPGLYWNPPRMAPSYALAEELNIYATRDSAAHLGWIYGPVFALWGMPAPDSALLKLLDCVALCHLPLGLAAVVKEGGGLNSMHSLNYFLLMLVLWLMQLLRREETAASGNGRISPTLVIVGVVALGLGSAFYRVVERGAVWLPYRGQEEMRQTARANTGRMYFPWNPLLTMITDKKIHAFGNALFCLSIAGFEPPVQAKP